MIIIFIWTDEDLDKIKKRDPKILDRIYKEYKDKVYNFLIIKTRGNSSIVDEVFCETFHSVLISAPKLKTAKNIQAWLLQIASRRLNDFLRKEYREKRYLDSIKNKENTVYESKAHDDVEKNQEILMINMALKNVKDKYKKILNLKYIEKKSQQEIADAIGQSITAVNSLLQRAREQFKKEFKKLVKEF